MHQCILFQAFFRSLNQLVPLGLDLVFHIEDLLALLALQPLEFFL